MDRSPRSRTAAVVFDLDGTLLDTMGLAPAVYTETIRALGGPRVSPAEVVARWHIGPTPVVLAHFLGRATSAEDLECYYRHFARASQAVQPFPGVLDMVDTLGRAGYRLGIFTSATRRAAAVMLSGSGLDRSFPAVVCGDEVDEPKPAPAGLWLTCRQLGVSAAATAYVGDAEVDLRCAEAAGSLAIHACWDARAIGTTIGCPVAQAPSDIARLV